jgi:energy-coupling factor transport system ATP-binding protein
VLERVWLEPREAPAILRGVGLRVDPGEVVALMGRNGAGKSTLLRVAAGLDSPSRGRVRSRGDVALLLQRPGDYLVDDSVGVQAAGRAGLPELADRHPRDLSGGERQLLAIAMVTEGKAPIVLLDEPTRGMDHSHKTALARTVAALAARGAAVVLATHDAELAAAVAARTVLLGQGEVVADAPTAEVLGGGWYFATQTARILGGGALDAEAGAALLRRETAVAR